MVLSSSEKVFEKYTEKDAQEKNALSSSNIAFKQYTEKDAEEKNLLDEITNAYRVVSEPRHSLHIKYLRETSEYHDIQAKRVKLSRKESISSFFENQYTTIKAWEESDQAKDLAAEEASLVLQARILHEEARRRENGSENYANGRNFMQLYTMDPEDSPVEENTAGAGRRPTDIQPSFQTDLAIAMNSHHPSPQSEDLWCPIIQAWLPSSALTAMHIFPHHQGQTTLDGIFGLHGHNKLNSVENGVLISTEIEIRISKGLLAIVPDVDDLKSHDEVNAWYLLNPRPYKIRVLDSNGWNINTWYPGQSVPMEERKTYKDLDNQRLMFRSNHRPRARYLYWQYCTSLLHHKWRTPKGRSTVRVAGPELPRRYPWDTTGPFIN